MDIICFPESSNEKSIFTFCSEVKSCSGIDELTIDFSTMKRIEPFAMAYVAKNIKEFRRENTGSRIICKGYSGHDYAAHMGFFRAFSLRHGRSPGESSGSATYIPLSVLRVKSIVDEASKEWKVEQEIIENKSEELAKVLSQQSVGNLVDTLTFSIREIVRNTYEHSFSRDLIYCAQYWPAYNKVEVAILDSGIGLMRSLKKNPHVKIDNDSDSIQQALMPSISSKSYKGAHINKSDPWHNSGFGLYMTNRICRRGGNFLICSGNHAIKLDKNGISHIELGHTCIGTAVRMVLNTNEIGILNEMLDQFKNEGYEVAKELRGASADRASSASQMLYRDFK